MFHDLLYPSAVFVCRDGQSFNIVRPQGPNRFFTGKLEISWFPVLRNLERLSDKETVNDGQKPVLSYYIYLLNTRFEFK